MGLSPLSDPLWEFSLKLYRRPGVEPLCLLLQNQWQADVNMLLWLRWLEVEAMPISRIQIQLAEAHISSWRQEVVWPLRKLRTEMKQRYGVDDTAIEKTRAAIKTAELQAERVVQMRLEELARTWLTTAARHPVAPGHNLALYAQHLALPAPLTRELQQILGAVNKL